MRGCQVIGAAILHAGQRLPGKALRWFRFCDLDIETQGNAGDADDPSVAGLPDARYRFDGLAVMDELLDPRNQGEYIGLVRADVCLVFDRGHDQRRGSEDFEYAGRQPGMHHVPCSGA